MADLSTIYFMVLFSNTFIYLWPQMAFHYRRQQLFKQIMLLIKPVEIPGSTNFAPF